MSWQLDLLDRARSYAEHESAVAELWVLGSAAQPELLDQWSDLDLGLVVVGELDLDPLLSQIGRLWALDQSSSPTQSTFRMIFDDGRRLDLVVADHAQLAGRDGRLLVSSVQSSTSVMAQVHLTSTSASADVNQARFVAAQSVIKLGRGDRLIGTHLGLELLQLCLVQAMLLRDRDEDRTAHRFGTVRDDLAERVVKLCRRPLDTDWRHLVSDATEVFDQLHSELEPHYRPDWSGLSALLGLR
ncbi:hypothetical protein GCM10009841_29620 [Microlunatus panaciterrae]|uniref:Nucleotidyltransferase domain-containing protein n=1 Tax=Microlunatus panaciterrae TaxID=400768 RepID=A0ABS2RGG3_9ACTN|nr:aminoglycoside 6-adenylyltransferase [Microlunatus panaciterrae]MBM7797622.1 hypothetical protein [Microlunatus panaciterrae]